MAAAPSNRYLGKFRGRVVNNNDPLRIGRITVEVPDVLGDEPSTWALPCLPFTGPEAGQFVVPPPGAGVWVEFEQGTPVSPCGPGVGTGPPRSCRPTRAVRCRRTRRASRSWCRHRAPTRSS